MIKHLPEFKSLGDSALIVQWPNVIDRAVNAQVHALALALKEFPFVGLIDLVPGYCSLAVLYDPVVMHEQQLKKNTAASFVVAHIKSLFGELEKQALQDSRLVEIPVCYDASLKNDLQAISAYSGISIDTVIDLHCRETYYVYMPGFLPGFMYMGEVNEKIAIPRKQAPVAVCEGAVAVAGRQTGIYPVDTPGGWHVLGYTPLKMFDSNLPMPCLLQPGNSVRFINIDLQAFHQLKSN